jgi:thiol-disulfide isomerase/thioredoxin
MSDRATLWIVLVAVLAAGCGLFIGDRIGSSLPRAQPRGVTVLRPGDPRADLSLRDLEGAPHRLSEWDGKLLLLNFWASWCGPCREELPTLDRIRARYADGGLEVIGVAIDDETAVRDFLRLHPVRYPVLIGDRNAADPALVFGDTRGVLPFSVLIGRDGRVIEQWAGAISDAHIRNWIEAHR